MRITLDNKWLIQTGAGPDHVVVEDVFENPGDPLTNRRTWIKVDRESGELSEPHAGCRYGALSLMEAKERWARVPDSVKAYLTEHAPSWLAAEYPAATV